MTFMQWVLDDQQIPQDSESLLQILLRNRKITDTSLFLNPSSPLQFTSDEVGIDPQQMARALERIKVAKEEKEFVIVFGDYDCDGICATAVLWEALHSFGVNVLPYIPQRQKHGYGLSSLSIKELCSQKKPDLLITVDNGITAIAQVMELKKRGIDVIITDHHTVDEAVPKADSIVHTTHLCGTTVAWMLGKELGVEMENSLDLCAIATVADQVPLIFPNRNFVHFGLLELNKTKRIGLQALLKKSGIQTDIDTGAINYALAPRLNAIGRLDNAFDALRLLLTNNKQRADHLVQKLDEANTTRQLLTQQLVEKAKLRSDEWEDEHLIILEDEEFHEGVIGLIAGKLSEEYYVPAICLSVGEVFAKGSARSIPGVDITALLRRAASLLTQIGGHPMAAGLRVERSNIESLKIELKKLAKQYIDPKLLERQLHVDCLLPQSLYSLVTLQDIEELKPFGSQNREPIFQFETAKVVDLRVVGKDKRHVKFTLEWLGKPKSTIEAIGFGLADMSREVLVGSKIQCVGSLNANTWNGKTTSQIILKDFKSVI